MTTEQQCIVDVLARAKPGDFVWCQSRAVQNKWYSLPVEKVTHKCIHTGGGKPRRFLIEDGRESGDRNYPERICGEIERRNYEYIQNHRLAISEKVRSITSVTKLKDVARLVGYEEDAA